MAEIIDQPEWRNGHGPARESSQYTRAVTELGGTSSYSPETVEDSLRLLALNGGNCSKTSIQLEEFFNIKVHQVTLGKWKNRSFTRRYHEIQEDLSGEVEKGVVFKLGDIALQSAELQEKIIQKIDDEIDNAPDLSLKDLSPALRNVSQAAQISIQQKQLLEDKPTQIIEARTIEQTIKELEQDDLLIEGESTDITDQVQPTETMPKPDPSSPSTDEPPDEQSFFSF